MTSEGDSVTTRFVPVVRCTTVSGVASTVTMRSGLRKNGAVSRPRRCSSIIGLALQVHEVLEHLVRGRDHPRVGLEATLRGDELGELGGEVHVGHLDDAG